MTIEDAKAIATDRGWREEEFAAAIDLRDLFWKDGDFVRAHKWQDQVALTHWSNFLTEDEFESVGV